MAKNGNTAVATQEPRSAVPAHLQSYQSTGAGVPKDAKDFLIPMAKVLDAKSPECERRGASYVQGAEAGDILIKNAPRPLIKGDVGFLFQPVFMENAVIEWIDRDAGGGGGGGFVARHPANYISARTAVKDLSNPNRLRSKLDRTHLLVDTRYVGGYLVSEDAPAMPLILPFSSTGLTVARQFNLVLAQKRLNGGPVDIWLVYYRIRTALRTRKDQAWYLFDIKDAGPDLEGMPTTLWAPTEADVVRGKDLAHTLETAGGMSQFATRDELAVQDDDSM
jgi:hypothetical protein